jgi:hypothetical protein
LAVAGEPSQRTRLGTQSQKSLTQTAQLKNTLWRSSDIERASGALHHPNKTTLTCVLKIVFAITSEGNRTS